MEDPHAQRDRRIKEWRGHLTKHIAAQKKAGRRLFRGLENDVEFWAENLTEHATLPQRLTMLCEHIFGNSKVLVE